jgi:ketosteroid isomerase-like protein
MKAWSHLIRRANARLVLIAAVLAFAAATAGAQDQRVQSDQEILMQLERDWDAAFLTRDVRVIDNILAEEFIATYDDGSRGDRAKELSLAAEFNQNIESSVLKEFTVKIYGDTAVVWFTRQVAGLSKGKRLELSFQYVDVFVFRAGKWQCVASQSTRVAS